MKRSKRFQALIMLMIMIVSFNSLSNATNAEVDDLDKEELEEVELEDIFEEETSENKVLENKALGGEGQDAKAEAKEDASKETYNILVSNPNGMEYRTKTDLHLRAGNSTSYNSMTIMPKGSFVKHLGTAENDWFKLDYKGMVGYAHRRNVTSKANYDKNYGEIQVSQPNGMEYRTIKDLDLREGNSDKHKSITVMRKGSYVRHLGTADNDWFKLDYDGQTGYAHRSDVTSKSNYDKNYGDKVEIEVSPSNGREYRTIKDLDLREGNSEDYKSITIMKKGSYVRHQGTADNDWFKLEYDGQIGYAHRNDVTSKANYDKNYGDDESDNDKDESDGSDDEIEAGESNGKEYVTTANLHLREGDSTNYKSILVMPKGSLVRHLGTTANGWYKIDYNGQIGYIHSYYLRVADSQTVPSGSIVFLDYGHGGVDPGAIGPNRRLEKDEILRVGLLVAKELRRNGVIVDESRSGEISGKLELYHRTNMANKKDYDYFVSIHRNAFNGKAYGVETFSHARSSQKAKDLSRVVQKNLVNVGFHDRGAKHMNLYVLRNTNAPAILTEVGFIDNPGDNYIFDSKLNELAKAIADGVISELIRNK